MTRDQLEHILRAAARITDRRDVIVIGSQAVLGSLSEHVLPDEAIGSIEADICFCRTSSTKRPIWSTA